MICSKAYHFAVHLLFVIRIIKEKTYPNAFKKFFFNQKYFWSSASIHTPNNDFSHIHPPLPNHKNNYILKPPTRRNFLSVIDLVLTEKFEPRPASAIGRAFAFKSSNPSSIQQVGIH